MLYFSRSRHKVEGNDQQSPIVILGSGLVSAPVVEYLSRDKNIAVTVGMFYEYILLTVDWLKLGCEMKYVVVVMIKFGSFT